MGKNYLDYCIHDRGFLHKKPQCFIISPTLMAEGHSPKVVEVLSDGGQNYNMLHNSKGNIEKIGELDIIGHDLTKRVYCPDGISPTLTACGGGNTQTKILDFNKFRVRKLTPKEYGRLQAFPVDNNWEQVVSDTQAYKQFGNAVTVNVVEAIARKIKEYLRE